MIRFLKYVLIAPAAILLLIFAFANRHFVTVSFGPFSSGDVPAFVITAPLFAVLIATAMLGVVAGAAATWLGQGRHRRAARQSRAEAEKWRAQAEALKAEKAAAAAPPSLARRA